MATRLTSNSQINSYVATVLQAARHHAPHVAVVIPKLAKEVKAILNWNTDKVEIYTRKGNMARTCWVTIRGRRYVFSYNYRTGRIDLRRKSLRGTVVRSFDNRTSPLVVASTVRGL